MLLRHLGMSHQKGVMHLLKCGLKGGASDFSTKDHTTPKPSYANSHPDHMPQLENLSLDALYHPIVSDEPLRSCFS